MLLYRLYTNDHDGGPVDFAASIAEVAGLSCEAGPLPLDSDTTFVLRVYDDATGLESLDADARVRVVVAPDGTDATARPNAPSGLTVRATAGGTCRVDWAYLPAGQGGAPAGFRVYLTAGATPSYATPAATVPYDAGRPAFGCDLSGLAHEAAYVVAVRACNASAAERNDVVAAVVGDSVGPAAVSGLASVATYSDPD